MLSEAAKAVEVHYGVQSSGAQITEQDVVVLAEFLDPVRTGGTRENSREKVCENNKTRFKTGFDEERSG